MSLRADLHQAIPRDGTPLTRLEKGGQAYLEWGMKHPGAYQLLFERPDPSSALGDQGPGVDLLGLLAAPLRELGFDADEAQMRSLTLWAALHGITSLRIHKPSAPWNRPATADIAAVIAAIAAPGRAS